MKHSLTIVLVAAASLGVFAAAPKDDGQGLEGKWTPVKAELGGQALPEAVLKMISLKLEAGKYEAFVGDKPDRGTYTVAADAKPKGMTVTGTEGPNKDKSFPAIYELDGDTLRICYDLSGMKRPVEFRSALGTKHYLVTYQRKPD